MKIRNWNLFFSHKFFKLRFSLPFPSLSPTPLSPTITIAGQHQNRTTTTMARSLRSPSTYNRSEFPPPFVALPPRRKLPAAYLDSVEAF